MDQEPRKVSRWQRRIKSGEWTKKRRIGGTKEDGN